MLEIVGILLSELSLWIVVLPKKVFLFFFMYSSPNQVKAHSLATDFVFVSGQQENKQVPNFMKGLFSWDWILWQDYKQTQFFSGYIPGYNRNYNKRYQVTVIDNVFWLFLWYWNIFCFVFWQIKWFQIASQALISLKFGCDEYCWMLCSVLLQLSTSLHSIPTDNTILA